jgi:hypothetical protein
MIVKLNRVPAVLFALSAMFFWWDATQKGWAIDIYEQMTVQLVTRIPDPCEVQQKLKALDNPRYDPGEVDGDPGQQTRQAWLNYVFDRKAAQYE